MSPTTSPLNTTFAEDFKESGLSFEKFHKACLSGQMPKIIKDLVPDDPAEFAVMCDLDPETFEPI